MVRSIAFSIFILLCFALFESAILSNIIFLPAVPDFLLLCVVYFSVHNGRFYGTITGFIAGLFFDFLTAAPVGLHCLLRTISGYSFGFFNKILNVEGFLLPAFIGFCATLYKVLLLFVISQFFPNSVRMYNICSIVFVAELIMNTVFTPFIFRFLDIFKRNIFITSENIA